MNISDPSKENRCCDNYFQFFDSLYELYRFDPSDYDLQSATVSYKERPIEITKRKVVICHDIPGGKNSDPICFNDFSTDHEYRFEHWSNIDSFIYFGHYRLTIPPPSWTNQAHKNGCKILGTLIFEWDDGAKECKDMLDGVVTYKGKMVDNDLGAMYYAEKIVEIAKFFKLDGYLMNFESNVPQEYIETALQFLEYLKMRLRDELGSQSELIWHDSVLATTGQVKWQSALRENNKAFFDVCDTFFTDYHWKVEYLDESLVFAGDRSYEVYYGNDVYGRGTYGGGIYNTHVALNQICKRPLSIAIFGQAYFFENFDGWSSPEIFKRNEEQFWEGKHTVTLSLANTEESNKITKQADGTYINAGKWHYTEGDFKIEKEENFGEFCVASHMWCKRVYQIYLDPLKPHFGIEGDFLNNCEQIIFEVWIKGTPPKCEDLYVLFMQVYDANGNELVEFGSHNSKAQKVATEEWVMHKIIFNSNDFKAKNAATISIFEMGKDIEYWAGNFGTRFGKEKLVFKFGDSSSSSGQTNHIKRILQTK